MIDSRRTKSISEVLAELDLSILMLIINSDDDQSSGKSEDRSAETIARLNELMQLLQEIVKIDNLRQKVFHVFTDQAMRKLLKPILEDEDRDKSTNCPDNLFPVRKKKEQNFPG